MSDQNMNHAPENGPPEGGFQPSPEFIQRIQRVEMAKALVEPDRVPFMPSMNNFYVYHYNKTTVKEWMEDCHSIIPSMDQYLKDYDPDLVWTPGMFPKNAMEIIRTMSLFRFTAALITSCQWKTMRHTIGRALRDVLRHWLLLTLRRLFSAKASIIPVWM